MTGSCVTYPAGEEFYGEGLGLDPEMLLELFFIESYENYLVFQ